VAADVSPQNLVPFRWPAAWTDPQSVSLLHDSPINCLVVGGAPQQIAEAARRAGLAVLDGASLASAPLGKLNWNAAVPVISVSGLAWPRMKPLARGGRDEVTAGPTANPWIDSNSWVAMLAMARAPGKTVWLMVDPPEEEQPAADAYRVAVADAWAAGARWVVSLDDKLSQGLAQGNAEAGNTWGGILETLTFFEKHAAWRGYMHQGPLGILSTFAGDDEFTATELLNLAARRNLLYRVIDRSRALSMNLAGLRGVLWVDRDPPAGEVAAKLSAFAEAGGLLIVPRTAASVFPSPRVLECPVAGYELRAAGRGRVAVAARDWDDPYFLAADAHDLIGRRNDPIRLFSGGACWLHYSVSPSGKDSLFQLVNFSWSRPLGGMMGTGDISFRIPGHHRSVTLHTLQGEAQTLQPTKEGRNIEYRLPQFGAYAAVEVKV
jgi:hypothetical protein